jgi:hypothetical protein
MQDEFCNWEPGLYRTCKKLPFLKYKDYNSKLVEALVL